ncbi:MAG: ATP-binding protein [Chloroflexota bacterium]|nr:ATP-binding protein [Chloroflexota bacterium]
MHDRSADLPSALSEALEELTLFAGVFEDEIGSLLKAALSAAPTAAGPAAEARLSLALVARAELAAAPVVGDAFTDWMLDRLLADSNVLAQKLDRAPDAPLGEAIRRRARDELGVLFRLLRGVRQALSGAAQSWTEVCPLPVQPADPERQQEKAALLAAPDAETALETLLAAYRRGSGIFRRYRAFRWAGGRLCGVDAPDLPRLEMLVGYERERAPVIRNTEQFVAGLPANDVLIAGARGTGKSSTIKALLSRFGDRGLRLVEVAKADLGDLPAIVETLRHRHERFILYVDDLSFEAGESEYKELKALLDGTIEARPPNVLVYATSNRHNLVAELWTERSAEVEVHARERQDEKLSLADRFGIRVFFPPPDRPLYLRMVEAIAAEAGLTLSAEELRQRAIHWEIQHSGRSGRLARQLVVSLLGEQENYRVGARSVRATVSKSSSENSGG